MCRVFNSRIRLMIMFRTVFAFATLQNKYNNLNAKIALMKLIFIYNITQTQRHENTFEILKAYAIYREGIF